MSKAASWKVHWNLRASSTESAARRGEAVVASTDTMQRMTRITSRCQRGQFYIAVSNGDTSYHNAMQYQWIIGIIRGLWYENSRLRPACFTIVLLSDLNGARDTFRPGLQYPESHLEEVGDVPRKSQMFVSQIRMVAGSLRAFKKSMDDPGMGSECRGQESWSQAGAESWEHRQQMSLHR